MLKIRWLCFFFEDTVYIIHNKMLIYIMLA